MSESILVAARGGLGDALFATAKTFSSDCPFLNKPFKLVHVDPMHKLKKAIIALYKTQGIVAHLAKRNTKIDDFLKNNKEVQYYLHHTWHPLPSGNWPQWELPPFPELHFNKRENIDAVIQVCAGFNRSRKFNRSQIKQLITRNSNRSFVAVGQGMPVSCCTSYVDKTTIQDLVDIICSCNSFVGPQGFGLFLAAMMKKDVHYIEFAGDVKALRNRQHPKWNFVKYKSLDCVNLSK